MRDHGFREEGVGVFDVAVAQADLLHHEARQAACFFVGRVIGETVQQLAEVVATREAELETQARRLEPCFGKGPRPIDDAAQFEIDQQAPEPDHRPALGVGERQALDFEAEVEGVETHLGNVDTMAELFAHLLFELPFDDRGKREEAGQQIDREQTRRHTKRRAVEDRS